jgi:hypothetical protein
MSYIARIAHLALKSSVAHLALKTSCSSLTQKALDALYPCVSCCAKKSLGTRAPS